MFQKVLLVTGILLIASPKIYSQEAKSDTAKSDSGHIDQYIPTITVEEVNDNQDDDVSASGSQNGTGMSFRSQDQFLFISGFVLGQYRFRPRGLDNMDIFVNGIQMQDLERGFATFGQLGGLNDVLRSRNTTYGLFPSEFAYGSTNGTNYIDATAANQRKGTSVSHMNANRNFRNRLMVTHNSGLNKDGWAWSVSASRRWANEGYVPGTFYDGYSFYGAVSKVTKKGQLNFTTFAAPTKRGQSLTAIDEVYQLANNNQYNPSWGYQNGEKRNSRVVNSFQPVMIANYTYEPNDRTRWNTAVGYEFGKYKISSIDFYNAYNPAPDYYRNLPSYYLNLFEPLPAAADAVRNQILANRDLLQVNWDRMYSSNATNIETIENVGGVAGQTVTGKRSLYALSNRVDDMKKISFNTNIEHSLSKNVNLYGGIRFVSQDDRYYKEMLDLMGGEFFLNYNQFASQQTISNPNFTQNDLKNPNQVIRQGDKYGYDYNVNIKEGEIWGQTVINTNKFDFFAAANGGYTSFFRNGFMQNGLFPDNSLGKSKSNDFLTYKTKGGILYKINNQHNLYVNADMSTEAPKVTNTYISARTRDFVIDNATTQKSKTVEAGYIFKSPSIYARVTGYATDVTDAAINKTFFNDDPAVISFVNYIMTGVNTRNIGTEFSGALKINDVWSLNAIAAVGQAFYTNRPNVKFYRDNQPDQTSIERKVYIKDYYLPVGPQTVYSFAINYRPKNYWTGRVNFNYTDRNYVDINPDRRTQEATDLVVKGSQKWNSIVAQEKLPAAFTIDLNAGKSFRVNKYVKNLKRSTTAYLNMGVVNALNKTDIKVSGFEQLRYDYNQRNVNRFPNKYDYAFGANYYVSLSLRF